jgi:hypothetical protein
MFFSFQMQLEIILTSNWYYHSRMLCKSSFFSNAIQSKSKIIIYVLKKYYFKATNAFLIVVLFSYYVLCRIYLNGGYSIQARFRFSTKLPGNLKTAYIVFRLTVLFLSYLSKYFNVIYI